MMKGFWHIVDATVACVIIVGFIAVLNQTMSSPPEDLSEQVHGLLEGLDEQGMLRDYAASQNYSGLNSKVAFYSYDHAVQICDSDGACAGDKPNGTNVWVGSYIVSGNSSYQPRVVKLYVWSI